MRLKSLLLSAAGCLAKVFGAYRVYEAWLRQQIARGPMPKHVAVILDGNRRWAAERGMPPWFGHEVGSRKVHDLLNWCSELGIPIVTLYALSVENLRRKREEVEKLLELFEKRIKEVLSSDELRKRGIRVVFIGDRKLLPERLREKMEELERATAGNDGMVVNVALAYSGREEIVRAAREVARRVAKGELKPEDISAKLFEKFLYTAHLSDPEPDLIIRTSGEMRLSGFLLWQSAYSELVFLDVYWPEFRFIDLMRAIRTYQRRQRRFGR